MKISKVAYENAPPYVRFLPKWGYVRLHRIKMHRRSVREVICTWRLRSYHFFPWRSPHGPTRGWYGNVSDIQSTIKGLSQLYFISKISEIFFSQNVVIRHIMWKKNWYCTHQAHIWKNYRKIKNFQFFSRNTEKRYLTVKMLISSTYDCWWEMPWIIGPFFLHFPPRGIQGELGGYTVWWASYDRSFVNLKDNFIKFGVEVPVSTNCQGQNYFSPGGAHGGKFTILTKFSQFQRQNE